MIYLHKLLPFFVLPVGLTLTLLACGLVLRRRGLLALGLAVLWLCSTPLAADFLMASVESGSVRLSPREAPAADAVVVLSGGRTLTPGPEAVSEWGDADRFFGGIELMQAGKAPVLVFTGGWVPWEPAAAPEGEVLARYARQWGIADTKILVTESVQNTAQEAQAVANLLRTHDHSTHEKPRILLVTSAFHMPRAQTLFERAGLTVDPYPVDFQVSRGKAWGVLRVMPNADALQISELALREVYGRLYYRWLKP